MTELIVTLIPRRRVITQYLAIVVFAMTTVVSRHASADELADQIRGQTTAALDALEQSGDFEQAQAALQQQFDQVIASADRKDKQLFRDAAFALRMVRQLKQVDEAVRVELLKYLQDNAALATTLAFLIKPDRDDPAKVYALLNKLRNHRADRLDDYANLVAAICVVHEDPFRRRVNENVGQSPDALAIFDYFVANEKRMLFGIRDVPAELLIYVVDTTASVAEMTWALSRYAGDPAVGARFFDIEYDLDHFRRGQPKKVTLAGYNLPNILRYGGVCADQAYYAMSVGKSIGVPTAYASGRASTVSHAWVGFLQARGANAWWNFDMGRYAEYQGVRGNVFDPQIRRRIPDSFISLLAELARTSRADRQAAAAFTDAALRLLSGSQATAEPTGGFVEDAPRPARVVEDLDVETILELIETALRISPGHAAAWMVVRDLAENGHLTLTQKKHWSAVLHRLCGSHYPDFYLTILRPMIESIDETTEQNAMWNKAFALFADRHDLAAEVRLAQGLMWQNAGEPTKAGACYEDVILRYANAGPFVVTALRRAEKILRTAAQGRKILMLYDRAFNSINKPKDMAGPFFRQSNFYRVGKMYAQRLQEAGLHQQAAAVLRQIGSS
ncbi:MAG: hypothetical protein IIB53_03085 [Planctomycetes bacterium]|nr:hypothetical protein [Planctomycetota bacterium]